jgi:hypothetical protein
MLTLDLKEKLVKTIGKTFNSNLSAILLLLFCAIGAQAHSRHAGPTYRAHSAVVTRHAIHQHRPTLLLPRDYIRFNVERHPIHRGNHHHSHRHTHRRSSRIVLRPQIVVIRPVRIVHR